MAVFDGDFLGGAIAGEKALVIGLHAGGFMWMSDFANFVKKPNHSDSAERPERLDFMCLGTK